PQWSERLRTPRESVEARPGVIDPRILMRELGAAIPPNALIVCGLGHFISWPIMRMPTTPGHDWIFSYGFGAIGQTLPVAIGAAIGQPDRPVVVIEGDGSIMMPIQELDTA